MPSSREKKRLFKRKENELKRNETGGAELVLTTPVKFRLKRRYFFSRV
jgi:hypothetical protein